MVKLFSFETLIEQMVYPARIQNITLGEFYKSLDHD